MFVVRAALGEVHFEKNETPDRKREVSQWRKPPERADGRGALSSVVAVTQAHGGAVDHPEFIVYEKNQTLAQFAIWYRHSRDCFCTHCVTEKILIEHPLCGTSFAIPADFCGPHDMRACVKSSMQQIKQAILQARGVLPEAQKLLCNGRPLPLGDNVEVQEAVGLTLVLEWRNKRYPVHLDRPGNPINLRIQFVQETFLDLVISPAATFRELKQSISECTGVLTDHQRLIRRGIELTRDEQTVQALLPAWQPCIVQCAIRLPAAPK